MNKGIFIVFEGGEGSGKSTQAQRLSDWLISRNREMLLTHEPGGTKLGEALRELLLHSTLSLDPRAEMFLFFADRAQHVTEVILPALERGGIVISDRFSGSTLAYQLYGRSVAEEFQLRAMDEVARNGCSPDLVVFLDLSPEVGLQRKKGNLEPFTRIDAEALAFHERVRNGFRSLSEQSPHWVSLPAQGTEEEVALTIQHIVQERFGL